MREPALGMLELGNFGLDTSRGQAFKVWPLYPLALSGPTYFVLGEATH